MLRSTPGRLGQSFFFILLISLTISACGSEYRYSEEKNYVLHANTDDAAIHKALKELTAKFNYRAGFTAIHYTDKKDEANSTINLVKGLTRCSDADDPKDKKIGCGQWLADVAQDDPVGAIGGPRPRQVTSYSMRLELDDEWFRTRMNATDSENQADLEKLYFHEVGHGLQMGHDVGQPTSMMYPNISGKKDYDSFFRRVRAFFAI